jgi:hypothetical protein
MGRAYGRGDSWVVLCLGIAAIVLLTQIGCGASVRVEDEREEGAANESIESYVPDVQQDQDSTAALEESQSAELTLPAELVGTWMREGQFQMTLRADGTYVTEGGPQVGASNPDEYSGPEYPKTATTGTWALDLSSSAPAFTMTCLTSSAGYDVGSVGVNYYVIRNDVLYVSHKPEHLAEMSEWEGLVRQK